MLSMYLIDKCSGSYRILLQVIQITVIQCIGKIYFNTFLKFFKFQYIVFCVACWLLTVSSSSLVVLVAASIIGSSASHHLFMHHHSSRPGSVRQHCYERQLLPTTTCPIPSIYFYALSQYIRIQYVIQYVIHLQYLKY